MVEPAPAPREAVLSTHVAGAWRMVVLAHPGLERARMEDAWAVHLAGPKGGPGVAAAVFDGVGGLPGGEEAAWAAARALGPLVAGGTPAEDLLARLHAAVEVTGGMTTAVVGLGGEGPEVTVLSVGDSSAYALQGRDLVHVVPHDVDADGLTACLGTTPLRTQRRGWPVPRGASLLLCTDGVDKVAPPAALVAVLRAPPAGQEAAMRALLQAVLDAQAPDNLAAVLLHRLA